MNNNACIVVTLPILFLDFDKTMLLENNTNNEIIYIIKIVFIITYFTILNYIWV